MARIMHVTAVTGNHANGQKLDKALVEYDCPVGEPVSFGVRQNHYPGSGVRQYGMLVPG